MQYSKLTLALSLVAISATTLAATAVAPANRIRIWDGPYAIPDSAYMTGTNSDLGTVRSLKYSLGTSAILNTINYAQNTGGLNMNSKVLTSFPWNGTNYERLSELGIPSGECVAFAKAMTGADGTSTWYKGNSLMSYLIWSGSGYSVSPYVVALQPGTMIAHFQGLAKYPQLPPYGHVAIFLSWSKNAQGMVDGINVVNANLVWTINGTSGAKGIIQKHKIPLSGSTTATYNSSGYHVVDVRGNKYQYTYYQYSRAMRENESPWLSKFFAPHPGGVFLYFLRCDQKQKRAQPKLGPREQEASKRRHFVLFCDTVGTDATATTTVLRDPKSWDIAFAVRCFHGVLLEKLKLPFAVRKGDGLTLSDISPRGQSGNFREREREVKYFFNF